uniref:wings apart-like protein homolog n=1 Tax=Centroberyx gerrardi TaxID=166262 RepID=UPI003AABF072
MTSRFGKTYSRKGGEGTSKFDEVLSNKRATLSTKWGETTYKAKVGSKRGGAAKNDSVLEVHKRPRLSDDGSEDPFGFDSDEESKPVSSRGAPQAGSKASPAKPASAEPPQAERPGFSLDAGSRSSLLGWSQTSASGRNQTKLVEDTARFFNSSSTSAGKSQQSSSSSEKQHSYSWYRNASESDKKPLAQTTTLKTEAKADAAYDPWDAIVGLRSPSPSPSQEPRNPPSALWASAGGYDPGRSFGAGRTREEKPPSPPRLRSPSESEDLGDSDFPVEPSESEDYSQTASSSSLLRNCRTYRRPNKLGSGKSSDPSGAVFGADLPKSTSDAGSKTSGGGGGRGRTRDYTVLHPSCLSVCNVTIQDRGVEEFSGGGAPSGGSGGAGSGGTTELGEAGWQRKKTEEAAAKPRFRQTQNKSKKDSKLASFGFEDADAGAGAQRDENSSDGAGGSSSYKIKYFGFDDMSDSDGDDDDDDDDSKERRKAKRAAVAKAAAAVAMETPMDTPMDSPPDPFEMLESRERLEAKENKKYSESSRIRTDVLDFSEDSLRVVAEAPRRPLGKPAQMEKAPDTHRRIFSGPKKSPTKAVYNARHWTVDSEEEPPPSFFARSQTAPASVSAGGSSKESTNAQKDDGVFKAPPPPPKVTKLVTFPTDLYQDTITTLKCRKEHKEVHTHTHTPGIS